MRKSIIILHTVLAAFFLPMGLMYAITGGLYGLGIKGSYAVQEHTIELDSPLTPDLAGLVARVTAELKARSIELPTGSAGVKQGGTSFFLEWTGSNRDVELHPTPDPTRATLKVKQTDLHRRFVQLHKAKGGESFKWFAGVWMVGLVLLFVTGGILAVAAKPFRKLGTLSAVVGSLVFMGMVLIN